MTDAGKYSLLAENKNGTDHVDLDLLVIDEVPVCDCDMFLNGELFHIVTEVDYFFAGSLECTCNNRYRSETSEKEMVRMGNAGLENGNPEKRFSPEPPHNVVFTHFFIVDMLQR